MLEVGVDLTLLNLNGPDQDPGALTCSGALKAVRQFHLDKKVELDNPALKLRLTGSSFGGYIVARFGNHSSPLPSPPPPSLLLQK